MTRQQMIDALSEENMRFGQTIDELRATLESAIEAGTSLIAEKASRDGFVSSNWEDRAEFCRLAEIEDPNPPKGTSQ